MLNAIATPQAAVFANTFSEQRAAQMAAYFLHKRGGRMAYLKLLKLLYLADREAIGRWGESISGDCFVSMAHGPVLAQTYDLIKCGSGSSTEMGWDFWVKDEDNYEVSLRHPIDNLDSLDELSDAEIKILDSVFQKFGKMRRFEITRYTRDYCAEWQDPHGSSFPITPEAVFRALGNPDGRIQALLKQHAMLTALETARNPLR